MTDPARPTVPRGSGRAGATADRPFPRPARLTPRIQPATLVGEGIEAGFGETIRTLHAHAPGAVCSTCNDDLAVPELNYRIVLRCSSPRDDV